MWTNLTEIIGWTPNATDDVVGFEVLGPVLRVTELCDQFFDADLGVDEVDRLIAWLTSARAEMAAHVESHPTR